MPSSDFLHFMITLVMTFRILMMPTDQLALKIAIMTPHYVLKGGAGGLGSEKCFIPRKQRFILVNSVKVLNVQPWGRYCHGEKTMAKKWPIFGHKRS